MVRSTSLLLAADLDASLSLSLSSEQSIVDPSSAIWLCIGPVLGPSLPVSSLDVSTTTESNGHFSESAHSGRAEKSETTEEGRFSLRFLQLVVDECSLWLVAPSARFRAIQPETFVRLGVPSRERTSLHATGDTRDRSISEEQSDVGQEDHGRLSLQSQEHSNPRRIRQVNDECLHASRALSFDLLQNLQLRQHAYR